MMFSRPSHPHDADGLDAARRERLERAGLRVAPRGAEPTATFVAIELAVLVIVSALAMVSVIVTTCSPAEARAVVPDARGLAALWHPAEAAMNRVAPPAKPNADRPADRPSASPVVGQ